MKITTERNYRRRIAKVVEAIIVEPTAPHSIESLAALAHFSPFHFHRLYRALTGENVATTVRRVRISQAAHRLSDTEVSVTQVALDAGYDSSQSFARAFRDLTGLSPSDFRASQQDFVSGQPEVAIVDRPSMTVLGLSHEGPPATIPHCYRRVRQWAADHNLDWTAATRVGHCQLNGPWSCLGWELGPWRDYAAFWAHVSLVQILKARARAAR